MHNLLDSLLRPFQIPLRLLGNFHSLREVGADVFQPSLRKCLKFKQLPLLGVEVPGTTQISAIRKSST